MINLVTSSALCFLQLLLLAVMCLGPSTIQAQTYPTQSIKLISPIPSGGAPDLIARIIAAKLSELTQQAVVVENRVGSNGMIAADYVAKSTADAHTLLVGMDSIFTINPYLYTKSSLDVNRELVPVATLGSNQFVLSANANLPVKSFTEFIEWAKHANPPLAYASAGNGSQHHLIMELLKSRAGVDLMHVPYKGGSPATTATVGGEVAVMFAGTSNSNLIKAGKLKGLASTGMKRSRVFSELPTINETYPDFEASIWIGLFAPINTPVSTVNKLRDHVNKALSTPEVIESLFKSGGIEAFISSQDEFKALILRDQKKYSKIIQSLKIKVD
jgi:tripartite-type tricarboxylate transporter receptor subunit TctC